MLLHVKHVTKDWVCRVSDGELTEHAGGLGWSPSMKGKENTLPDTYEVVSKK